MNATVPEILTALDNDSSEWAKTAAAVIRTRSPASLTVTAEHLNTAKEKTLNEVLDTDFILAQRFVQRSDLYEGIRAAVIDKKHLPEWEPESMEDITEEHVKAYFTPTGYGLDDVKIFAA